MVITDVAARALSIAETAGACGLSAHALRCYERAGLLGSVERKGSGHRRFREADLERIGFLTKLRATGMPIRDVRRSAERVRDGAATNEERLALLEAHRAAVLAEPETTARDLELIERKVDFYRQRLG